jgi:hypothetical protein
LGFVLVQVCSHVHIASGLVCISAVYVAILHMHLHFLE